MRTVWGCMAGLLLGIGGYSLLPAAEPVRVTDDASLRSALRGAGAGTVIRLAPGRYQPGVFADNLQGTPERPIVIEGEDPQRPPLFEGGSTGWQLSDCAHLVLRNIAVRGQRANGINIDDGGSYDTPSHHLVLDKLHISEIGPRGNFDGIKLSGVDDFVVRDCAFDGWGGQAIDMVGCHRGAIEDCTFQGREGFSQDAGPQTKGGSSQIAIRGCVFLNAGGRAVNVGGSTGLAYFRPRGARYEAKDILVEGCVFAGSQAPVALVGVDGAVVRYNTIFRPDKWVLRILQETTEPGFAACRNGRFEHNLIVFRRAGVAIQVNIGPHTSPETFVFADNLWYCEDRPQASRPDLPTAETGGVYGIDPQLAGWEQNRLRPQNPQAARFGASAWPGGRTGKD